MSCASLASPSMTGMMGCSPGCRVKPAAVMAERKRAALANSWARKASPSSPAAMRMASSDEPQTAGARALEKR
ncbi:hypothetical protein D3C85_1152150 [compost metagenome]